LRVLLVDWLGRGGIAQCTEAWAHELRQHGHEVTLVCPPGRELMGRELARGLPEGRIMRHRALVELAADSALEMRPDVVVLNNYLIPLMEQRVLQAARSSGARVVAVVHNVRPHSAASASKAGLGRLLRGCDQLVVHSRHEAMRLDRRFGLTATCLPLPVQIGLVGPPEDLRPVAHDRRRLCQFGVMKRRYKHADLLHAIADRASSWDAVALGVGAREHPRIETVEGFLAAQELVEHLRTCSVALFPYRAATQSGGVVLATVRAACARRRAGERRQGGGADGDGGEGEDGEAPEGGLHGVLLSDGRASLPCAGTVPTRPCRALDRRLRSTPQEPLKRRLPWWP